ncbi:MAG: SLBB domain-containing protein [Armatimonadetes bacterium]|nr:SLBB domain-containing protein [Armatimonadota bacterium]
MLLLLLTPCLAADEDANYKVDAGDILEVLVPRYAEFSKPYLVTRAGSLVVDLIGAVPVRGLTPGEIAKLLETRLAEFLRHPEGISVRVAAKRMTVRVLGQVVEPGLKEVPREANAHEVISAAGGPKLGALLTRVTVRRKRGDWIEEIPVDLKAYLEGRVALPPLQSEDEVFVPKVETDAAVERPLTIDDIRDSGARGKVQVLGSVRRPGEQTLTEGATLLTVISAAGGWTDDADLSRVRRVPGGEGQVEVFDLQAYLDDGGTLPRLGPGDVVSLPPRLAAVRQVRVLGAVKLPGPIQLPREADLQTALTLAGGVLPNGDTRHVRLVRREGRELVRREIDLEAYLRGGDPALLPPLQTDDIVFVPKATLAAEQPAATVYLLGQVAKPGPYPG